MNGQFQVARASGTGNSGNSTPPRIFKLSKPLTDQAVVVNLGHDQKVQVDFSAIANEKITLVHLGEKLIILFDNHATLTVEPFFDSKHETAQNLTIEVAPGRDVSVSEFASLFPIPTDQSVLPAAGNGDGNAHGSGANFSNPAVDPLVVGNPLSLLGPETFGNFVFTNPTTNVVPIAPPTTDNFTVPTDEDSKVNGNLTSNAHVGQAGDTLTFTAGTFSTADGGTVKISADGTFTYDPTHVASFENIPAASSVTDSFKFTVTDNHGDSSTATATIVVSVNDPKPVAIAGTVSTDEDTI